MKLSGWRKGLRSHIIFYTQFPVVCQTCQVYRKIWWKEQTPQGNKANRFAYDIKTY